MNQQWQIDLVCCTEVIVNEVAQGFTQKQISLTYALTIRSESNGADNPDWPRINGAIAGRWGPEGLEHVKRKAWKLIQGGAK